MEEKVKHFQYSVRSPQIMQVVGGNIPIQQGLEARAFILINLYITIF